MKTLPKALAACSTLVIYYFGVFLRPFDFIVLAPDGAALKLTKGQLETFATVPMFAAAIFVILAKRFAPSDKYWAYAVLGAMIGFWLHPQRF